jgi:hypothetical protein
MHSLHPSRQLSGPRQDQEHAEHHLESSAACHSLQNGAREPTDGARDAEAPDDAPFHMSAEKQEAQGCTDGVRDSDGGHGELGADLKCQNRSEQAADSKSAHSGYCAAPMMPAAARIGAILVLSSSAARGRM